MVCCVPRQQHDPLPSIEGSCAVGGRSVPWHVQGPVSSTTPAGAQNFLALVPLALLLGEVTEDLAIRFGDVIGGLLVRHRKKIDIL